MPFGKSAGRVLAICACVGIAVWGFWSQDVAPRSDRPATLRVQATPPATVRVRAQPEVGRMQPIALDAATARRAMRDGTLQVTLPDGTTYPVRMRRQETDRFGQWSVIGEVRTSLGPQSAVLTFGGNAVFGTLPMPDGHALQIVTNNDRVLATLAGGLVLPGRPAVSDIANTNRKALADVRAQALAARSAAYAASPAARTPRAKQQAQIERIAGAPGTSNASTNTIAIAPPAMVAGMPTSPITVTVLAVYSDDLIALRGTEAAVQTELSNLVAAANQAHIDSGTMVRLSLVAKQKLAIPATMDNYDAMYAMTVAPVGDIDTEVLRTQYAADLVTLVRPAADHENCGIAWMGGAGNYGTMTLNLFAYSVVNTEPCGPHVMAHETGHSLGSAHDRGTVLDGDEYPQGAFPFSFGYRHLTAPAFATIMAYAEDEPWLGRFSNPASSACGAPCGIANESDNVRSLGLMAKTVSEYRGVAGKATISDVDAWEPDPGTGKAEFLIPIRLNGFAGANPPVFTMQVVGGTATAGVDYVDYGVISNIRPLAYYDGEAIVHFEIYPDTDVEGDETIIVKIASTNGYPIADDTAVLTIHDDDPRPHVRMKLVETTPVEFPHTPCTFYADVLGINGPRDLGPTMVTPLSTDCTLDLPVAPGSNLAVVQANIQRFSGGDPPYLFLPQVFNAVRSDRRRTVSAPPAMLVRGQLVTPPDTVYPPNFLQAKSYEWFNGHLLNQADYNGCCAWFRWVYPGATLEMRVQVDYQFRPWFGVAENVGRDTTLDANVRPISSFVVRGGQPWPEGRSGRRVQVPVVIQVVDGTGEPEDFNPVTIPWHTVDGTAKAGSDYVAASGTVTIMGNRHSVIVPIEIIGDDLPEPPEYFNVVIDPVAPYNMTVRSTRITIADDDHRVGGPQPLEHTP